MAEIARPISSTGTAPVNAAAGLTATPPRNTARDTWDWMWKDTLFRVVPFVATSHAYSRLAPQDYAYNRKTSADILTEVLAGIALGVPMAVISAAFRARIAPRYRLPTAPDQALQTAFYFAVNAPAEEMFWRGFIQTATIRLVSKAGVRRGAPALGWALATAAFGAYHRLGHWSWKAIGGVTVAGGVFGALHLLQPRRGSLVLPAIVHGFATAGFLSWGDVALHAIRQRTQSSTRPR